MQAVAYNTGDRMSVCHRSEATTKTSYVPWIADNSMYAVASTCFHTLMKTPLASRSARKRALTLALFASPSLALLPAPAHAATAMCGAAYTVRPGDSLWSIGAACGVSPATLRSLNASTLGRYLLPGQTLRLSPYTGSGAYAVAPNSGGATAASYGSASYVVRPGDALDIIARRLNTLPAALAAANGLSNVNLIRVGQVLRWPVAGVYRSAAATAAVARVTTSSSSAPASSSTYLVRPGDTLSGIALSRNLALGALAAANGITNGRLLRAGSVLRLPLSVGAAIAQNATAAAPATPAAATTTVLSSGAYQVKPGDTLSGIALALGLTPGGLAQSNGLNLQMPIQVGQLLRYAVVLYNGPSRAEVGAVLDQQSATVGIEDALLKAIAWRESSWRMVDAADGGIGVMQLMPDTVTWLRTTYVPGAWDPHNLTDNVHAGAVLLLVYSHMYGGNLTNVATAYHGGMGVVGQTPTAEMTHYIDTVAAFRQSFLAGTLP